ncbi:MAG: helix-turn-helix transcriptional regulator [Polyangiales bacterium]
MSGAQSNTFGALLRYWRNARGLSQLDLANGAEVSSRHLSFLETGRAKPSREMILQLSAALDVPMREQNTLLRAAGFTEHFSEPGIGEALDPLLRSTVDRMMAQQEPYPLVVMNSHYDIVQMNGGAMRLFAHAMGERIAQLPAQPNALKLVFDPAGLRPVMAGWEETARELLLRLQRGIIQFPADTALKQLLSSLCGYPEVPPDWRIPNFESPSHPTVQFAVQLGEQRYGFLTALTVFNAPQNITIEELRLESYFPLDSATDKLCRQLAAAAG